MPQVSALVGVLNSQGDKNGGTKRASLRQAKRTWLICPRPTRGRINGDPFLGHHLAQTTTWGWLVRATRRGQPKICPCLCQQSRRQNRVRGCEGWVLTSSSEDWSCGWDLVGCTHQIHAQDCSSCSSLQTGPCLEGVSLNFLKRLKDMPVECHPRSWLGLRHTGSHTKALNPV